MQSLASQFYAFIVTVIMGLTVGLLYDFYRFTKGIVRPGKLLGYMADVSFWVISTLTVFFLLLIGNWGEIRMYVIIGVLIGTALYFKLLSSRVIWVLQGMFYCFKTIFMYCVKIVAVIWMVSTYPFNLLIKIVIVPIGYLSMVCGKTRQALARLLVRTVSNPASRLGNSVKNGVKSRWISLLKNLKIKS